MRHVDLVLLHPPSNYKFRELPIFHGPISVAVPSSSIFENYPDWFSNACLRISTGREFQSGSSTWP